MTVEPKSNGLIIVTCKPGSESSACYEVGDLLFPHNTHVKVEKTGFPGVIVAQTHMDPYRAYSIILTNLTSYVLKAYPLVSLNRILELVAGLLSREKLEVSLRCELRGRRGECSQALKAVTDALRRAGVRVTAGRTQYTLHIEGVENLQGYSLLPSDCENLSKVYENEKLKKTCLEFVRGILSR